MKNVYVHFGPNGNRIYVGSKPPGLRGTVLKNPDRSAVQGVPPHEWAPGPGNTIVRRVDAPEPRRVNWPAILIGAASIAAVVMMAYVLSAIFRTV